MNFLYIPIGIVIGLVVAAPIGPVNLIAINRTLRHGVMQGVLAGLGAAIGDGLFALIAAFGFTTISSLVENQWDTLRLIGGAITIAFAWFVWRAKPHTKRLRPTPEDTPHLILAVFMLTITNPATLGGFTAIFAAYGFTDITSGNTTGLTNGALLVSSVFLGSLLWWLALGLAVSTLRGRISDKTFTRINHSSAMVLFLLGAGAMIAGLID